MPIRTLVALLVLGPWVTAAVGCKEDDQIRSYRIGKPAPAGAAQEDAPQLAQQDRPLDEMLGAIVPHGTQTWFFKVTGRAAALAQHADAFRTFIGSIRFGASDDSPQWTLPAGWQQRPASGMRFATLQFGPTESPFELTVIPLQNPSDDTAAYALSNVNRWRGQLGLPPIGADQLAEQTEQLQLNGATTATIVRLQGQLEQGAMMPPRFGSDGPQSN